MTPWPLYLQEGLLGAVPLVWEAGQTFQNPGRWLFFKTKSIRKRTFTLNNIASITSRPRPPGLLREVWGQLFGLMLGPTVAFTKTPGWIYQVCPRIASGQQSLMDYMPQLALAEAASSGAPRHGLAAVAAGSANKPAGKAEPAAIEDEDSEEESEDDDDEGKKKPEKKIREDRQLYVAAVWQLSKTYMFNSGPAPPDPQNSAGNDRIWRPRTASEQPNGRTANSK